MCTWRLWQQTASDSCLIERLARPQTRADGNSATANSKSPRSTPGLRRRCSVRFGTKLGRSARSLMRSQFARECHAHRYDGRQRSIREQPMPKHPSLEDLVSLRTIGRSDGIWDQCGEACCCPGRDPWADGPSRDMAIQQTTGKVACTLTEIINAINGTLFACYRVLFGVCRRCNRNGAHADAIVPYLQPNVRWTPSTAYTKYTKPCVPWRYTRGHFRA